MQTLETLLDDFPGVVLCVSHDKAFMERAVDRMFVMEGDGLVRLFDGDYIDYLEYIQDKADAAKVAKAADEKAARAHAADRRAAQAEEAALAAAMAAAPKVRLSDLSGCKWVHAAMACVQAVHGGRTLFSLHC